MEKSEDRLRVLEKIAERERKGEWDLDVETDPEAPELLPHQVDYLNEKLSSKIKTFFAANLRLIESFQSVVVTL